MSLAEDLGDVATAVQPAQFDSFQKHLDPRWIAESLEVTGTATIRRRRLPAEQVVWLVIGMAMFAMRSMRDLVASLDLAMPGKKSEVAPSAITQARSRVGEAPLSWLFERSGRIWATRSAEGLRWRGLAVLGMDMSTLRVADSQENRTAFGGQSGDEKRGESGYPMVRLLALMVLRSHILLGARVGPYKGSSEMSLAKEIVSDVPDDSLLIMDRGYLNWAFLEGVEKVGKNRHWLTRAKSNTKWKVIHHNGPGDDVVEMPLSAAARKKDPSLPKTLWCRAVRYQRKGFRPQTLLTSLLQPSQYPAKELASLYHERWEIELGFGEVKTDLRKRQETLRSKTPDGVLQETWGLLLAYNLIRVEMEQVAAEAGVSPMRISFVMAMNLIQNEWLWCSLASPGTIPEKLQRMRTEASRFVLPERRPERTYPRAVKVKMSNYARKRPTTTADKEVAPPPEELK